MVESRLVCNIDERDDFIRKFGKDRFLEVCKIDPKFDRLQDIPVPEDCLWLWSHFLTLFYSCAIDMNGNRILRPVDILDYCECFGINMTYRERRLMLSMKHWACSVIYQLENSKED